MSQMNLLVFLQAYSDSQSTNAPNLQNVKWTRDVNALSVANPLSQAFDVAPGQSMSLFSGVRTLSQDNTTTYSLALAPFSTSTYQLSWVSGTSPAFRTLRTIGTDATSQVTVSSNGPVLTFSFTGGTLPNLASAQVGDEVLIGNLFNQLNQGIWKIISTTSSSVSVVNSVGYNEGPINLGVGFANQLRIFSAAGVQIGDTLVISGGFSPVTQGSYQITQVTDSYVQFSSTSVLPIESNIVTEAIAIYSSAKSLVYIESDQNLTVLINGSVSGPQVEPFVVNNSVIPGIFMINSTVYSLSVVNNSINPANVLLISVE